MRSSVLGPCEEERSCGVLGVLLRMDTEGKISSGRAGAAFLRYKRRRRWDRIADDSVRPGAGVELALRVKS